MLFVHKDLCNCDMSRLFLSSSFFLSQGLEFFVMIIVIQGHGLLLEEIYISTFSIGTGPVPWVVMSEIFPINIKGIAGSLMVLVTWLGAWSVSFTFIFLMDWSTFFVYSGFSVLAILYVAKFLPETKGKTLEEIQNSIDS
uniref:Major facilitator superfamily (MFS) profile domain-containing protein n=1 Tax=Populus trichocarpa TaxID=3694 RepID=B9HM87_POPTR